MRKKIFLILSMIAILVFDITTCFADNPMVQTIYTADPAPMVYNGTCYVYTGHDEDTLVNNFFTMNDWRCYSSTDMANWTDLGSPLSYTTFGWAKGDAWAGQCIQRNGKFYYYVPMTQKNGGMAIGVAVSKNPSGPFTDAIGKPLVSTGTGDIDPTVFIDDDGQAYLYWGNPNLWYVKLNQDMISYSGSPTKIPLTTASFGVRSSTDRPTTYEEGPWFYKRNGLYYMVFAAGPVSEHIGYSTSTSPIGPWTYRGKVMPTQGASFTNHPGVCDYKGNSYFFYHNGALPGGSGFHRSVCVEQFKYNADGTIPTMNMTTKGPAQIGNLNPYVQTEAETISWESGVETEKCSEGGIDVCNIENGDYIKVKGVDFGAGAESFEARVASASSGGNIELRLDSPTGTLVGTCAVTGTGGWQTWVTKSCTVSGATGIHDLYLKFTGGSGSLFNFNWWKFTSTIPGVTPSPIPTPTPSPRSAFTQNEAEEYDNQSGIQTESCNEGGQNIGYIENGNYAVYDNVNFGGGAASFQARAASATSGGNIELRLDSITGPLVGTCPVTGTGDWQTWVTATCNVSGVGGVHDLYLKFTGDSGYLFNLNWWKFNPGTSTPTLTPMPTPTQDTGADFKVETNFSLSTLVPNQMLTAKVTATNISAVPYSGRTDVLVIVGLYDSNNTMVNVSYISKGIAYQGTETLSAGFKLPGNTTGYVARAFMWDGTDIKTSNMIPISNAVQIPDTNPIVTPKVTPIQTPTVKATPTPTTAAKFHCFLLLGQSNMAGYAKAEPSDKVEDLRKDLNLGNVPFLAGELLYSGPCAGHNTLVNQLPSLITNCYVVSANGLVVDPSDTTYRLHFSHDSSVSLGKRYAEKMIQALGW